jgi:glucosamine 6-phosphate synthetase-like amidotransferase/phosphosugar isomerase protein
VTEFLKACYDAICRQATSIPDTIKAVEDDAFGPLSQKQCIVLLGCGDSYAVAEYGKWAFLAAGISAVSVSPPELQRLPVGRDRAVIGVSASGRSLVTIEALELAKSLGATTVALTDNATGKVAQIADMVWKTNSGIESYNISPSAPTTAALAYILAVASKLPSSIQDELQQDCRVFEVKAEEIVGWSEREGIAISNLVKRGGLLYLISDGPNYVAAQIGMMKLDEFSITKGLASLKEEFQHHYNLSIGNDERAVLVLDDPVSSRDETFSAILKDKLQMKTYLLHTSTLNLVTPLAQAIANTIALQMASYHVVRRYQPNMIGFKQPHADAFKIY